MDHQDQTQLKRYLLNLVTDEHRDQIEQRIMTDENYSEELEAAEDDLIDGYISGDLGDDERARFEEYFLATPERQDGLRFARALRRYVSSAGMKPAAVTGATPVWITSVPFRIALAAIGLAVVVSGLWFYRNLNAPKNFATLTLSLSVASRAEGAQSTKIKFPSDADGLKVSLLLPPHSAAPAGYRAALLNERGEMSPFDAVGQDGQSVNVTIPASKLARGQYALKLFRKNPDGTEQAVNGSYLFTVE